MQLEAPIPLATLQTKMAEAGVYAAETDGVYDLDTGLAVNAFLLMNGVPRETYSAWNRAQKLTAVQQLVCRLEGIPAGPIDGKVGPQVQYAVGVWHARQRGDRTEETWRDHIDSTPAKQAADKWPSRAQMNKYYGPVGSNQMKMAVPYPLRIAWALGQKVETITCHKLIAEPTQRALQRALEHYGLARIRELRLDVWGGTLNVRKVRGGSSMSIHAWGAAHDWDPERNQLKWKADRATLDDDPYDFWWECWEAEGAVSQGRALGFDWMHVQFSKY